MRGAVAKGSTATAARKPIFKLFMLMNPLIQWIAEAPMKKL
jgi:hypothetical protein